MTNFRWCITVATVVALFFAGCSRDARDQKRLVIGVGGSLNLGNNNPVMIQRNANVWESLTELDNSLVPRPMLADSWSVSENGKHWIFELKKNVRFHDGVLLTASLVKANVERLKTHPELDLYSVYVNLESAEILDEQRVSLRFSKPIVDLPGKTGHFFAGMFSPNAIGLDGKLRAAIGSGPYVFVESKIGQYDLVRAFDGHHEGRPYFDEIEFRIIPDPAVRVMSLLRGDIDMIAHHGGVPITYLPMLENKTDIVVESQDLAITHYLLFNAGKGVFSKPECRDAIDRMLDRRELAALILQDAGAVATDFLSASAPRWNRHRFQDRPDPTAKFCEITNPLRLVVTQTTSASTGYRYVADYLADYFGKHGIPVELESVEGGAWQKIIDEGDYDITLYGLSSPTGAPELMLRRLAYSKGLNVRGTGNSTGYRSENLDRFFGEALIASDLETQESLFHEALDLLAREKPLVPLFHERYHFAYRKGLQGVQLDPFLKLNLKRLHWGVAQ